MEEIQIETSEDLFFAALSIWLTNVFDLHHASKDCSLFVVNTQGQAWQAILSPRQSLYVNCQGSASTMALFGQNSGTIRLIKTLR